MQLFPSSFTTRAKVATILATVAVTLVVVLAALNLMTGEKPIKRHLEHQYAIADPQFQRTLGVLLGPVILPDNRFEVLLNGDQIFPAMLGAIRRAQRTITFETYIYWSGRIGDAFADALAERARAGVKVHVLLGIFNDPIEAVTVAESFALLGAVDEETLDLGGNPATRLTLTHLKPGVARADVVSLARQLGLSEPVI